MAPGRALTGQVNRHCPHSAANLRFVPGARCITDDVFAVVVATVERKVGRLIATETLVYEDAKDDGRQRVRAWQISKKRGGYYSSTRPRGHPLGP